MLRVQLVKNIDPVLSFATRFILHQYAEILLRRWNKQVPALVEVGIYVGVRVNRQF